jgi:hypothetical protein
MKEQLMNRPTPISIKAGTIAFVRIFLGIMWLFEVTVGHNWKIGGFTSGPNPLWIGPEAGAGVSEAVASAVADGTYSWFGWIFETIVAPNAAGFGYAIIALQVLLGVAFIIGVAVRPLALLAMSFDLGVFMLGNSRIPPFFSAAHLFVLVSGAGMYYGLDGWIMQRTRDAGPGGAKALRWLIELPVFRREYTGPAIAIFVVIALFFVLTMPQRKTTRFEQVALDLAALSGLIALGLYAARLYGDRLASLVAMLRIFVGFKFLHEIWARNAPGHNALPGFAGPEAQAEIFQKVVDNHWSLFAWLTENVIMSAMGFWVVVFGAVQFIVGVALVTGYRTRLFGSVGLLFLGALIVFGMTRYPPFLFGLLIPVVALDGGRVLSLDRLRASQMAPFGLPIPAMAVPALIALAAVNALAATITAFTMGIVPNAYIDSMPSMTTAFVAIFSGLLAFVGWLQHHPELDRSGEIATEPAAPAGITPV